jgi:hypothetical protein
LIKPSHRGLLHKELGVPEGEKIPMSKLLAAKERAKKTGDRKLMEQVEFALNFGRK